MNLMPGQKLCLFFNTSSLGSNNKINELTGCFPISNKLSLLDVMTMTIYEYNVELINSGIKNGSVLALI